MRSLDHEETPGPLHAAADRALAVHGGLGRSRWSDRRPDRLHELLPTDGLVAAGPEDHPCLDFDAGLFAATLEGYAEGRGGPVDERLCLRAFLIDVVRDCYFGFDAQKYASRHDHNVARATAQFRLGEAVGALSGRATGRRVVRPRASRSDPG
jgi:hypothetical protein